MTDFGVRVLARDDGGLSGQPLALREGARYGVGASWDSSRAGGDIDIDLQCVVADNQGIIIDCAYYNNLKAVQSITHSGDEVAGRADHVEEMIWVNFQKLPAQVELLIFVVAAYKGGTLQDIYDGRLHVFEDSEEREVMVFEMERSRAAVDIVAVMARSRQRHDRSWGHLHVVDEPAQQGRHFMDILPLLSRVIRDFLPHAPQRQKVAFAMEKGGVLDLPQDLARIIVGLGWDVDDGECDIDVSCVLFDKDGQDLEAVFFGRLESPRHGIRHTGDNLTGEGEGDDEQIIVQLDKIGENVEQVVFVVNVYTPNRTFKEVAAPYCRVVDDSCSSELCRYSLREAGDYNGLIVARISREVGSRWGFHALGLPCRGRTYKDALPQMRSAFGVQTSSLKVRSVSSDQFLGYGFGAPSPAPRSSICALL